MILIIQNSTTNKEIQIYKQKRELEIKNNLNTRMKHVIL